MSAQLRRVSALLLALCGAPCIAGFTLPTSTLAWSCASSAPLIFLAISATSGNWLNLSACGKQAPALALHALSLSLSLSLPLSQHAPRLTTSTLPASLSRAHSGARAGWLPCLERGPH
jgi:hypothetical protein